MEISLERLWAKLEQIQALLPFLSAFDSDFTEGEIYLVGGAVRDLLLGRETKDYDFLVRGVPANRLGRFLSQHGKVNWVGKSFGVYKFMPTQSPLDEAIDIALPRTEESFSQGGGYRDFEIQSDPTLPVEEDLRRRDFTINAMAADLKNNILIDPFNGLDDLRASLLRAVGEATRRFSEDSSRLLRGLRFAAQLDLKFEAHSWTALKKLIPSINARRKLAGEEETFVVPRETIAKEFIKAMVLHPVRAYDLWDESGAFEALIPELLPMKGCAQPTNYHSEGDVWVHTRLALSQLATPEFQAEFGEILNAETVLAVLFHDIAKPVTIQTPEKDGTDRIRFNGHDHIGAKMLKRIVTRLKLSSFPKGSRYYVDGDHLCWLVQKHLILVQGNIEQMRSATIEKYFLNPLLPGEKLLQLIYCDGKATVPEDGKTKLLHYWEVKKRIEKIAALSAEKAKIPRALLSGRDVMQILNVPSGPEIGKYLGLIREEQLSGRISVREEAVAFLKDYLN